MSAANGEHQPTAKGRRPYQPPELRFYGDVVKNTKRGAGRTPGAGDGQFRSAA